MVSVDRVSLYTKIPICEDPNIIAKLLDFETLNLTKMFLSSTFRFKPENCTR